MYLYIYIYIYMRTFEDVISVQTIRYIHVIMYRVIDMYIWTGGETNIYNFHIYTFLFSYSFLFTGNYEKSKTGNIYGIDIYV
jgi:hypothetical protein